VKKTFVLDTNILLHDPKAMFNFEDNEVIIPIYVVEEIDNFKKDMTELGRNARQVSRNLDALRADGSLLKGIRTKDDGIIRVAVTEKMLPAHISTDRGQDSKILATALDQQNIYGGKQRVILVTKDSNLRIRSDAVGIESQDYEHDRIAEDEFYTGVAECRVSGSFIDDFYSNGVMPCSADLFGTAEFGPNQYVALIDEANESHTGLARVVLSSQGEIELRPIVNLKQTVWGLRPRNREQHFALDALLDDSIRLVTLVGKAGTGKTLLAIAAGLSKTTDAAVYQRCLIARPVIPLGRDIGYLPGSIEDKLNPWMQPVYDNVEFLMGLKKEDRARGRSYRELIDMDVLQVEPLTYIRGRSIPNQ
jgi:PhoH-like ATPase